MTPVGLHDGTRDRKSEPCAFTARLALGATAMEAIEDSLELIGGDGVAGIAHDKADAGGIGVDLDRDLPAGRRVTKRIEIRFDKARRSIRRSP